MSTTGSTSRIVAADHSTHPAALEGLLVAVQKYLDMMYDCDISRFDEVFAQSANLHGEIEGRMVTWSADAYREVLKDRKSPKSLGAGRSDHVLFVDFAAPDMALVKVRVNIAARRYIDYLTWHRISGQWRITAKGYYIEDYG